MGIPQARILVSVAIPSSRESSPPRDQTQVSRIAGRFFTNWATREALSIYSTTSNFQMSIFMQLLGIIVVWPYKWFNLSLISSKNKLFSDITQIIYWRTWKCHAEGRVSPCMLLNGPWSSCSSGPASPHSESWFTLDLCLLSLLSSPRCLMEWSSFSAICGLYDL